MQEVDNRIKREMPEKLIFKSWWPPKRMVGEREKGRKNQTTGIYTKEIYLPFLPAQLQSKSHAKKMANDNRKKRRKPGGTLKWSMLQYT